jgi:glycine betaine/proline transport system substrate-binding protein
MSTIAKAIVAILVIVVLVVVVSVVNSPEDVQAGKTASLVYVNWAEGVAYTHVAQVVLEEKMGYEVSIIAADVAPAYTSVAQADNDAFMETWPVIHAEYLKTYAENIYDVGKVYEGTQVGLVVPRYMVEQGVETISDLKKPRVVKKLNGEITGIDSGAGMMQDIENEVIPQYELDKAGYELIPSSGPAMTAALKRAIENEEYIVVAGWKPHWKFGVWDLAFLKQDGPEIWGSGDIHIYGNINLPETKPELSRFLENMYLTDEEMASLLVAYKENDDAYAMAKQWVQDHAEVWQDWIP